MLVPIAKTELLVAVQLGRAGRINMFLLPTLVTWEFLKDIVKGLKVAFFFM